MLRFLRDHPAAFDPETIDVLSDALDQAWRQVEADKDTYKIDGHAQDARNVLARSIVDMAKQGERDPQRLISGALAQLRL